MGLCSIWICCVFVTRLTFLRRHGDCVLGKLQASLFREGWQHLGSATRATDAGSGWLLLCGRHPFPVTQWNYRTEGGERWSVAFVLVHLVNSGNCKALVINLRAFGVQEWFRSCSWSWGNTAVRSQPPRTSDQPPAQFAVPSSQVQLTCTYWEYITL